MRTKALFNSSLYLAVSTSSLARPVRSLQSNAIFNQPSACHFAAEEMEQIKNEKEKNILGRDKLAAKEGTTGIEKVPLAAHSPECGEKCWGHGLGGVGVLERC